jgi:hypothetical protein
MSPNDKCNGIANRVGMKRRAVAAGNSVLNLIFGFPRSMPIPMPKKLATRGRFFRFAKTRTSEDT